MEIRTAVPADLAGISHYDRHISPARLEDCVRRGLVHVLVSDERIVGVLRWNLFWQSLPFLDLIFLDEAFRGLGWGTKMMAHWENAMACQGFTADLLSTQEDETAKFFYEKLGYTLCGSFLPPDQDVQELLYRKELKP